MAAKQNRGFTLLELSVAIGLMAVMFSAISVVFTQATNLMRRSESEIALYQNFRVVFKTIKKDFESILNYEDPLFYSNPDPRLNYCGYLRIDDSGAGSDKADRVSFLMCSPEAFEIQNYVADNGVEEYVRTHVRGTNLLEVAYGIENAQGSLVGGGSGKRSWRLMRYTRRVVDKDFVSGGDPYGLAYLNGLNDGLTGASDMSIFNGSGRDNTIWTDYTQKPPQEMNGRDPSPNKYGERAILAEGCTGFDIKYWSHTPDGSGVLAREEEDPYVTFGDFYNGMPPNPANFPNQPNLWYLPRMMQIKVTLTDRYGMITKDFWMRVYIPSSNPRPKVR